LDELRVNPWREARCSGGHKNAQNLQLSADFIQAEFHEIA
jgi:hypothetical protein